MKNGGRNTPRRSATRAGAFGSGALAVLTLATAATPALATERSLAGIKIFSSTRTILQKYKNPSQVIVGRPSLFPPAGSGVGGGSGGGFSGASGGAPGGGGYPGGGGFGGGGKGSLPGFGGGGGVPGEFGGGGGGMGQADGPSASGGFGGAPGIGGMGGFPGAGGANGTDPNGSNPGEVTWVYDKPNGNDIEFTMSSDGRVIQVRATGYKNAAIRTSKGVTLGQTYAQVVSKYGYPESQEQMGTVLTARYTDRDHVAFQFFNQRLVAIIVAAVD